MQGRNAIGFSLLAAPASFWRVSEAFFEKESLFAGRPCKFLVAIGAGDALILQMLGNNGFVVESIVRHIRFFYQFSRPARSRRKVEMPKIYDYRAIVSRAP